MINPTWTAEQLMFEGLQPGDAYEIARDLAHLAHAKRLLMDVVVYGSCAREGWYRQVADLFATEVDAVKASLDRVLRERT